jgi:glycosyltransferase involved in cell wall biosynthesis
MSRPWLLVAGDFTPLGGMDAANHALARHLAARGADVHLVTHRAWPDIEAQPTLTLHAVRRPFGRHLLGAPLLARAARDLWGRLGPQSARAVINGGNCNLPAANWVHYLHAAYEAGGRGSVIRGVKRRVAHARDLAAERQALQTARVVICNSRRTRDDVVQRLGIAEDRVRVVYYGSDPLRFSLVDDDGRRAARTALGLPLDRGLVGFVGALGDRRKAFDTVFAAWASLCRRRDWDADLVVVGAGAELPAWKRRAADANLAERIRFLGFRQDVPAVLATLDALVHPARYEAYGLSVHEALCRGVPAIVTGAAGVAEMYPDDLQELLIEDPDDAPALASRLLAWRPLAGQVRARVAPLSRTLRARTWDAMAAEIAAIAEQAA